MRISDWSSDVCSSDLTAVLLRRLFVRLFSPSVGLVAAGLWLVLPLRTSLEIWMSTGTAALAQLLAVGGLLLLAAKEISWRRAAKLGRASCRERGRKNGSALVGPGTLKKKTKTS